MRRQVEFHFDEPSPETVIYPLAPDSDYGTIYGVGRTGVTQQIVIAPPEPFSGDGRFRRRNQSVGPFSVPATMRFMLGCAASPATRLTESNETGTFGGLAWIFETGNKVATWRR
jgi:hypothetical protein